MVEARFQISVPFTSRPSPMPDYFWSINMQYEYHWMGYVHKKKRTVTEDTFASQFHYMRSRLPVTIPPPSIVGGPKNRVHFGG